MHFSYECYSSPFLLMLTRYDNTQFVKIKSLETRCEHKEATSIVVRNPASPCCIDREEDWAFFPILVS